MLRKISVSISEMLSKLLNQNIFINIFNQNRVNQNIILVAIFLMLGEVYRLYKVHKWLVKMITQLGFDDSILIVLLKLRSIIM